MTAGRPWRVVRCAGSAAELHEFHPPEDPQREVRVLEIDRAAIVLGSSQHEEDLDPAAVRAAGVDVARRRSGGGAVLLVPGLQVWIDLWLPVHDPLRVDDVIRSADWVGDAWARAAVEAGFESTEVHRGPAIVDEWSRRVCFAGRGPGEVFVDGRKLVGLSQRRTRAWLRYQTMIHRRWDAAATFGLFASPPPAAVVKAWQERVAQVGDLDVASALLAQLPG